MDKETKARLEAQGWKIGSTEEFFGLTPEEASYIEIRLKRWDAARESQHLSSRGSQRQPRRGGRN